MTRETPLLRVEGIEVKGLFGLYDHTVDSSCNGLMGTRENIYA